MHGRMSADGTFDQNEGRPNPLWVKPRTNTRNNVALWPTDRPIPMNYEIPMAWHHMIPWEALYSGWTALVNSGHWDVIEYWLHRAGDPMAKLHVSQMKQGQLAGETGEDLAARVCWAPWNLVEGPEGANRGDDPGSSDIDIFASSKVSATLRTRCYALQPIYSKLRHWTVQTNTVSAADAALVLKGFQGLVVSGNTEIAMFDPKVWQMVDKGNFNPAGQAIRHPTWIKAK